MIVAIKENDFYVNSEEEFCNLNGFDTQGLKIYIKANMKSSFEKLNGRYELFLFSDRMIFPLIYDDESDRLLKEKIEIKLSAVRGFSANYERIRIETNDEDYIEMEDFWIEDNLVPIIYGVLYENIVQSHLEKSSEIIRRIINKIKKNLKNCMLSPPSNEYDVHNVLEIIFKVMDLDFERDKEHIVVATKTKKPDFTFDDLNLAIEVKFCKSNKDEKRIIDELNSIIIPYKQKYSNIVFIIYDQGFIVDEDKIINYFDKSDIETLIIKGIRD